jgi:hypothetical protein
MPRTPAEAAIYLAERPVYDGCARIEKSLAMLAALRSLVQPQLRIDTAEAAMDDIEGDMDRIGAKLGAALAIHVAAIERMQLDEEIRYARAHGLFALAAKGEPAFANDNIDMDEAA